MPEVDAIRVIWIVSSAVGTLVCGYTLRLAIVLFLEHRRRNINHGRDIITKGFIRRNIKRTTKMTLFFAAGIMAYFRVGTPIILWILVLGNVADTVESILELRDDRRLENIYIEEKRKAAEGGRRKDDFPQVNDYGDTEND